MEVNISDLLDELQDDSVQIQTLNIASTQRVKELTMKKIREEKRPRRSRGTLGRVVLVAAILVAMATTVLAASGFSFSNWINRSTGEGFEEDVFYGSGSMFWEIGDRMFRVSVTEAEPTGARLEWWNQDADTEGLLTTDDGFWLEKWDGSKYVPLEPLQQMTWPEKTYEIPDGETPMEFHLDWENLYGHLETGYYRIGKTFTLTLDGESKTVDGYAKFRLYAGEMEPYLEKCREALNTLLEREDYHIRIRQYPGVHNSDMFYDCLYSEIWKRGADYLRQTQYILEAESGDQVVSSRGSMLRDGGGYSLEWENRDVTQPVSWWEGVGYIDNGDTYYTVWLVGLDWYESIVGEVYAEGNRITLVSHSSSSKYPYDEHVLTFNEEGNLILLEHYYMKEKNCAQEEKVFYGSVEVLDTSPDRIARLIDSQDVTTPNRFSWVEDQAAWPDAQREGFANTQPRGIEDTEDVVELALADCAVTDDFVASQGQKTYYNKTKIFYDSDAAMWKVEFSYSQDDYFHAVYLDDKGITQMVVTGQYEE